MKKAVLLIVLGLGILASQEASAQDYHNAIGLRLGYPLAVSYKHYLSEKNAFEIYAGTRGFSSYRWTNVSAAYQIHNPLGSSGLKWYFGAGATVLFYSFGDGFIGTSESSTAIGVQGYLGLEYTLGDTPLNFTLDWVPTYLFTGYGNGFGADGGSLGVRYVLGR